jgi:hypothetical protein
MFPTHGFDQASQSGGVTPGSAQPILTFRDLLPANSATAAHVRVDDLCSGSGSTSHTDHQLTPDADVYARAPCSRERFCETAEGAVDAPLSDTDDAMDISPPSLMIPIRYPSPCAQSCIALPQHCNGRPASNAATTSPGTGCEVRAGSMRMLREAGKVSSSESLPVPDNEEIACWRHEYGCSSTMFGQGSDDILTDDVIRIVMRSSSSSRNRSAVTSPASSRQAYSPPRQVLAPERAVRDNAVSHAVLHAPVSRIPRRMSTHGCIDASTDREPNGTPRDDSRCSLSCLPMGDALL